MRARKLIVLFLFLTGLLFATWIAAGQQTRRIDDQALRNAGKTGEEWLTYGLTPGETRYSPLKQIDTSNVSRLGPAWSYDVGPGGGNQEGTPLFWNGSLYGITNWSVVFAVDARTGQGDHRRERFRVSRPRIFRSLRREYRTTRMALLYDSWRSFETIRESCAEKGSRDLVRTVVEARRGWNRLGRHGLRSRGGSHICRNGQRWSMAGRASPVERQRQLVCVFDSRR